MCCYQKSQRYMLCSWLISRQIANYVAREDLYVKFVKTQAILFLPLIRTWSNAPTVQRCFTSKYENGYTRFTPLPPTPQSLGYETVETYGCKQIKRSTIIFSL